jgi:SAM-dependent methyltransferase
MVTRQDYQMERLNCLKRFIDPENSFGLEIGACDLPTVPPELGKCQFADFRSKEELINCFNLPPETVVPVRYILNRNVELHQQIDQTFDYIILCHVIEHVPDVISYIQSLRQLLNPNGIILIACPDKRRTPDISRSSTTIEHLLADYYHSTRYPNLEHVLEGSKAWGVLDQKNTSDYAALYEWACQNFESGLADTHCHVWIDNEFFSQIEQLIHARLLGGLEIVEKGYNKSDFNEFFIALKASTLKNFIQPHQQREAQAELNGLRSQLSATLRSLDEAKARVKAMETSKFWKLRSRWFELKKALGLANQEGK